MKKKLFAMLLALSMLLGMVNTAFAADASSFKDMPNDWSRSALEHAVENGLIQGTTGGYINSAGQLTRAEMAVIIVRAFGATEKASLDGFSDVSASDWYYDALQKAVAMGVLYGSDGKLDPAQPITREQVCAILYRAFLLQDGGDAAEKFKDAGQISGWAQESVAAMASKGYINGDSSGNVNPTKPITRAEFAQLMDNLVKSYPTGSSGGVVEGNVVMRAGDNLSGMTVKGDLILADGLGLNDVDLSDCTVEGRIVVRGGSEVRLSGTTSAKHITAASSVKIENNTGSKLEAVSVESESATVTLSGAIGRVDVKADNVTVNASSGAKIDVIEIVASGTTAQGDGQVAEVQVKEGSSDTKVTTSKTEITVDTGAGTVISANGTLSEGQTGTTNNAGALQTGGTTSSGTSSGGSSTPPPSGSYTVTGANGQTIGTFAQGTVLTINNDNGTASVTVTVTGDTVIPVPEKTGCTFKEWTVSDTTITAVWEENQPVTDSISLVKGSDAAKIYISKADPNYDGISLVANAVADDIEAVTGIRPDVVTEEPQSGVIIVAGTVDADIIEAEGLTWQIAASNDSFKSENWERYQIQTKQDGGKTKIVIAGADKRGTIYGMFHITQDLCGVSPWIYWADAVPTHRDELTFTKAQLETTSKRPSVNYRGIFLNDENPSLDGYADSHFGGLNYMFYDEIFELLLRLKGNFLWPAMWSNDFNLDGMEGVTGQFADLEEQYHHKLGGVMYVDTHADETGVVDINALGGKKVDNGTGYLTDGEYPMSLANAVLADRYGIVVGASHHEPMARSGREWGMFKGKNYNSNDDVQGSDKGVWNFLLNPTNISNFWSDAIARNGSFDNLLTIGMRGENDSALKDASGHELTTEQNIELLKSVLRKQDEILQSFGLQDTPQLIALYKEVENCWYGGDRNNPSAANGKGLRNDSAVQTLMGKDTNRIVMLCEDNNGYLRTLPEIGQEELYNWGMYYHFDYVGGPHTSMWMNTMPLQRTWDNMTTAYEYGVDDAWIVNVGDLKPMELPISYFIDMAYDFETYGSSNPNSVDEYTQAWVKQQFAKANLTSAETGDLVSLLDGYTKMNGDRKPERMKADTFSAVNYNEAQEQLADAIALEALAETYLERFKNTELYDAYYELVYYPAAAAANANKLWCFAGLNQLYASRNSMLANVYAELVTDALDRDRELTAEYNKRGATVNGLAKWYRMMVTSPYQGETVCGLSATAHFNYSSWNPESSQEIPLKHVSGKSGSELIVDVQGVEQAVTSGEITMLDFENIVKQAYALTLSNGGNESLENYSISNIPEWILVDGAAVPDTLTGGFYTGKTYGISVDWSKVNENKSGTFTITSGGQTVTVKVNAKIIDTSGADQKAAIPSNGEISIVANNYSSRSEGAVKWTELENYGKTGATMKMLSAHTDDYAAGSGPWIEYKVYVPADQAGTYKLTVYFGQSNNVSFDEGDHLNIGLQVNGGSVETKNTLKNGYVAGGYTGWDSNIMDCGHTMDYGAYTLNAGENTVRIYGMDQNVMLQKLVLSKDNRTKTSYRGPQQSYMPSMGEVDQQPLVCYQTKETMFLPGTIAAKDCSNEGVSVTNGVLSAEAGVTYEYPVNVTTGGKYLFNVTGSGSGSTVTLKIDGKTLTYELPGSEDSVANETDVTLKTGSYVIEMTVSGSAQIRSIMGEIYDDTPGLAMTVSSTGGDEDNAGKAFDRKNSSAWKPTESNPSITLNLSEKAYADYFVLNGDFAAGTTVTLTVGDKQIYSGAASNGAKVYFHGKESVSGKQWKFSFNGTVNKLSEVELNTYVNWALEDTRTSITTTNTATQKGQVENLINGNRQGPRPQGWLASGEAEIVVTFGNARTLNGVNLIGMEVDVSNSDSENGFIPTDTTCSGRAPTNFDVQYLKADGSWSNTFTVKRSDGNTRPVLQYVDFGGEVTTKQVKIKAYGAGETRMMEIEAIHAVRYTANGIDRTTQNWALSSNGGTVTSYTNPDGSGAQTYPKLNDGNAASYEGDNSTRESFAQPKESDVRYVEITLTDTVKFSELIMYAQRGVQNETEAKVPTETGRDSFQITPATVEYFDGEQWKAAGSIAKVEGGYRDSNGKVVFRFEENSEIISNRIRVKWDSTAPDNIRLIELEVYGTMADMPVPEEPAEPDPTDGLTNLARNATITATVTSGNPEGNTDALKDGDISYNNGNRWRVDSRGLPAEIILDLGTSKTVSVVDVISQLPDNAKDSNGKYPEPTLETTTNLGLKDIEIYSYKGEGQWEKIATGEENNTLVWQRFVFENAITTSQIKIVIPDADAVALGWARLIEIQVWGEDSPVQANLDEPEALDESVLDETAITPEAEASVESDEKTEDSTQNEPAPDYQNGNTPGGQDKEPADVIREETPDEPDEDKPSGPDNPDATSQGTDLEESDNE